MLQRQGRVSYRALKRQFALDDEYLEDLKVEIIEVHQLAVDQDGRMLVWTGDAGAPSESVLSSTQTATPGGRQDDQAAGPERRGGFRDVIFRRVWGLIHGGSIHRRGAACRYFFGLRNR